MSIRTVNQLGNAWASCHVALPLKLPWLTNLLHFDKQTRKICFSFVRGETTPLMTHRRSLWCHFLWHVTATIQIAARIRILKRSRCGHQPSHSKLGDIWQRRCHVSHVWLPYFLCIFFLSWWFFFSVLVFVNFPSFVCLVPCDVLFFFFAPCCSFPLHLSFW